MCQAENTVSKVVATEDGKQAFQVRYIRDEKVGIVTTQTGESFFILDSQDYWYDLTQDKYPPLMKCSCKNDFFSLTFDYTPKPGTEDYREIRIFCRCTACQKVKKLPPIQIDYSPSSYLFDDPITFCAQPKIKYKTHSLKGYWSIKELQDIVQYFVEKNLRIYGWYWDSAAGKRCFQELSTAQLRTFLSTANYLAIFFSEEALDDILSQAKSDEKGIVVQRDLWRKRCVFQLSGPLWVYGQGLYHHIDFCAEYLEKDGTIVPKASSFCNLVQDFRKYSKKLLKK